MSDEKEKPAETGLHVIGVKLGGGSERHARHKGMVAGLGLILVGVLFLLENLGYIDYRHAWEWWPLVLVGIGLFRLLDSSGRSSGVWLVFIGLWLFVNEWELWGFTYRDSWPLVVVFVGLSMVWKALRGPAQPPRKEGTR